MRLVSKETIRTDLVAEASRREVSIIGAAIVRGASPNTGTRLRVSESAIGAGIVAEPISPAEHVIIAGRISNAGNVAAASAYAIRVILVIASGAGNDALQYAVIVEPECVGPRAGADTGVGERVAIERGAVGGASAGEVVVARGGVADADAVGHHLVGRTASAV